jgi:hypothetical protein
VEELQITSVALPGFPVETRGRTLSQIEFLASMFSPLNKFPLLLGKESLEEGHGFSRAVSTAHK